MSDLTVSDVMHVGIITADPGASVTAVAALMADRCVHSVVVEGIQTRRGGEHLVWGIVTDMDLLTALHSRSDADAARLAATEPMTVAMQLPLEEAVTLMVEHDLSHVVVVDEADGRPVGVLSSLDVARAAAMGVALEA